MAGPVGEVKCMKKKLVITVMIFAVMSIMLAGCKASKSGSSDSAAQKSETSDASEENGSGAKLFYPALSEGSTAPDFTAELNDGSSFVLSDHEGEVILLNFWATWCGPCVEEMPAFQKLYEEYGDKIQILAVDLSEDKSTVDAFVSDAGYTFPIAYDENGEIGNKYPSDGIPYTVVIGKDGKVSSIFLGSNGADEQYKKYRSALEEAFSE